MYNFIYEKNNRLRIRLLNEIDDFFSMQYLSPSYFSMLEGCIIAQLLYRSKKFKSLFTMFFFQTFELDHRKFCTIHCTGYLRSWPPNIVGMEEERDNKKESNFTCLVAIGRLHPYIVPQNSGEIKVKPTEFITRFAMNGKFVYVDQRWTFICHND